MENEARNNKKLDFSEIQVPAGPRLGSTVLEANHIHKAFGERVLIDDLSFTLPRNGIVGVIGPNGVGKSTLFKTIVGLEPLTSGELKIGDTVKISYVDQNREGLDPNKNLWEAVSGGLDFIEVAGVEVPTRAYAVSYTHLDVYKRQVPHRDLHHPPAVPVRDGHICRTILALMHWCPVW